MKIINASNCLFFRVIKIKWTLSINIEFYQVQMFLYVSMLWPIICQCLQLPPISCINFFFFFFCHLLFVHIGESLPLALTLHRDMIDRCKILVVGVVRGIYIYIWVAYSHWKKNKEDKKIHFPRILSIRVNRIFFAVMETLWLGWHKGSSSKRPS